MCGCVVLKAEQAMGVLQWNTFRWRGHEGEAAGS